jgi:hypothetical protein
MMEKKHVVFMAVLLMGASAPAWGDEQKPPNPQEQNPQRSEERFVPRLNDMMVATQLRHFKLWYAGIVQNWSLANYELEQIRDVIADTERLFPNRAGSRMSAMMKSPTEDLEGAIKAKDGAKFANAYTKLTAACNSCHEADGFGFIKIREPRLSPLETSPFTDESFSGK